MDQFQTISKLWPSGIDLPLGTDFNSVTVPSAFDRYAANFVTSMDGANKYQFLFWNTGRHLTNKRHVHWSFGVGGWGLWTATRWYGTPSPNGGPKRVHADAFSIGGDTPLSGETPIDGTMSTYASGAWPFQGNDHEIGTAGGDVTVVAKDPFASLEFAGWLSLVWGGDDSGTFYEDDSGASPGAAGFFEHVSGPFSAAKGTSADLLATYGNSDGGIDRFRLIWEFLFPRQKPPFIRLPKGDPGPDDYIRIKVLQELIRQAQPWSTESVDFRSLIETASQMSKEELTRAMQSVQTSLDLGKAALSALEVQLKRVQK